LEALALEEQMEETEHLEHLLLLQELEFLYQQQVEAGEWDGLTQPLTISL
jgi:hypothetical protein